MQPTNITAHDRLIAAKLALNSLREQVLSEIRIKGLPKQDTMYRYQQAHIEVQDLEMQAKYAKPVHKRKTI